LAPDLRCIFFVIIVTKLQINKKGVSSHHHFLSRPLLSFLRFLLLRSIRSLHVRTGAIRLGGNGLALDALSAGVVLAGILADAGGAGVGGDGRLAGAVAFGVTGGVVGAETLLLGLLLLELLAGTGAAAD